MLTSQLGKPCQITLLHTENVNGDPWTHICCRVFLCTVLPQDVCPMKQREIKTTMKLQIWRMIRNAILTSHLNAVSATQNLLVQRGSFRMRFSSLSSLNSRITFLLQSRQNLLLSNLHQNFIQRVIKLFYIDYKHIHIHNSEHLIKRLHWIINVKPWYCYCWWADDITYSRACRYLSTRHNVAKH